MRVWIHALAAVGVLAVAAPASALTIQPASRTTAASGLNALFSDPAAKMAGAGASFQWSIAGDSGGVSGLPVYFEPTQAGSQADEDRYAADPVGFVARVNGGEPATNAAKAPTTVAAPKAPLNGR